MGLRVLGLGSEEDHKGGGGGGRGGGGEAARGGGVIKNLTGGRASWIGRCQDGTWQIIKRGY